MTTASPLTVHAWMKNADGTQNHGVRGFEEATVLVSGERAKEVATQIADYESVIRLHEQTIMTLNKDLNEARSKLPPKRQQTLIGEGCIRQDQTTPGALWLLSKAETGWAAFGFRFDGWDDLLRRFNLVIGDPIVDSHGMYWPAHPASEHL